MNRRQFLTATTLTLISRKVPMPTELQYQQTASGVLDASGNGSLTFNGPPSQTVRKLSTVVVQSSSTARPQCSLYRSSLDPSRLMGRTRLGDSDTFINDGETLSSGEPLIVAWTGGTPGATIRANVNGTDVRA